MLAFDVESTGVDVESEHILSASLVHIYRPANTWRVQASTEWINPGVPIPPGSTAIHGITDEFIRVSGGEPAPTLDAIVQVIATVLSGGTPLVGANVPYDLTILDRNCRRHGVTTLSERMEQANGAIAPCIDVQVLDKRVDPYRKGKGMRQLGAICPLYRVEHGSAHDSQADALAAARIAYRIGRMYRKLGGLDVWQLHLLQQEWKLEQDASLAAYFVRMDRDATGVDGQWPIRALPEPANAPTPAPLDDPGGLVDAPLW